MRPAWFRLGRVTDLVELLEKVDKQKAEDMRNNVVPGDCIEFVECTIITPKVCFARIEI